MRPALFGRVTHWLAYDLLLLLCSGYALLCGGGPERAGAMLMLVAVAASAIAVSPMMPSSARYAHFELALFGVDLAAYVVSLVLMLRAERFWTIWMNALLALGLLAHLLAIPDMPSLNLTYAILERVWGYPLAMLPAIGAWRHRRRLKLYGSDNSWSASWRRFPSPQPPSSPTD